MCEGPVSRTIPDFTPHQIKPGGITFTTSETNSFDSLIRECPCSIQNDTSLPRFVKRTRTISDSRSSNSTHGTPDLRLLHQQTRESLNAETLPGRTNYTKENHSHVNTKNQLAGKRKMCDPNVNRDDDFKYTWPLLTQTSDDEDTDESHETSDDSSSDSETYSGPS